MSFTIWKYPVSLGEFKVDMPQGAKILDVQIQGNDPVIWAIVEPDNIIVKYHFFALPTGGEIDVPPPISKHIGTFQLPNGLVFHLFYLGWE